MNRFLISALFLVCVVSVASADTTYRYVESGHRTVRVVMPNPNGCGVYIINYREPIYVRQPTWTPWQQTPIPVQQSRPTRPESVTPTLNPVIITNPFVKE